MQVGDAQRRDGVGQRQLQHGRHRVALRTEGERQRDDGAAGEPAAGRRGDGRDVALLHRLAVHRHGGELRASGGPCAAAAWAAAGLLPSTDGTATCRPASCQPTRPAASDARISISAMIRPGPQEPAAPLGLLARLRGRLRSQRRGGLPLGLDFRVAGIDVDGCAGIEPGAIGQVHRAGVGRHPAQPPVEVAVGRSALLRGRDIPGACQPGGASGIRLDARLPLRARSSAAASARSRSSGAVSWRLTASDRQLGGLRGQPLEHGSGPEEHGRGVVRAVAGIARGGGADQPVDGGGDAGDHRRRRPGRLR